jgi:hypothetical protein
MSIACHLRHAGPSCRAVMPGRHAGLDPVSGIRYCLAMFLDGVSHRSQKVNETAVML